MLYACSSASPTALPPGPHAGSAQPGLFGDPPQPGPREITSAPSQRGAAPEWTEEDVVLLHWRLLHELRRLSDPEHPLADKIDALNWVFTDPDKEARPFSFRNCLRVVGCSPLSPAPYVGLVDPETIREWIRAHCARWLQASLARYPDWMRALIAAEPDYVVRKLDTNPQWINEQVRQRAAAGDLFE